MEHFEGTLIRGTMRAEGLIPTFTKFLQQHGGPKTENLVLRAKAIQEFDGYATFWILDALFAALDDIAPEGYYFGAHIGDGADFGFWPVENLD